MADGQGKDVLPIGSSSHFPSALTPLGAAALPSSRLGAQRSDSLFGDLRAMIGLNGLVQPRSRFDLPIGSAIDLALLVRRQRATLGMSQAELARRAKVGRRFVCELEADKSTVRLDQMLKVLSGCGLSLVGQGSKTDQIESQDASPNQLQSLPWSAGGRLIDR